MKYNSTYILPLIAILFAACSNKQEREATKQQNEPVFAKGEKLNNDHFTGTVYLNYLVEADTLHHVNIGSVSFEPGARTNWHYHKGGQILLVTAGKGLYQEKGKPAEIIQKGEVVKCPPNIEHWHGATATEAMTHIAIGTNTNMGGAVWLQAVTEEEYRQ